METQVLNTLIRKERLKVNDLNIHLKKLQKKWQSPHGEMKAGYHSWSQGKAFSISPVSMAALGFYFMLFLGTLSD